MKSVVNAVDRIVRTGVDAVRPLTEQTFAEGSQEVALTVEDNDRMFAPVEHIHMVLAVHRDAGHVNERPPLRQLLPALDRFEHYVAATESHGHAATPLDPHLRGPACSRFSKADEEYPCTP